MVLVMCSFPIVQRNHLPDIIGLFVPFFLKLSVMRGAKAEKPICFVKNQTNTLFDGCLILKVPHLSLKFTCKLRLGAVT